MPAPPLACTRPWRTGPGRGSAGGAGGLRRRRRARGTRDGHAALRRWRHRACREGRWRAQRKCVIRARLSPTALPAAAAAAERRGEARPGRAQLRVVWASRPRASPHGLPPALRGFPRYCEQAARILRLPLSL